MPDRTEFTFVDRHIGPDADALSTMLGVIGVASLDELAAKACPRASSTRPDPTASRPGWTGWRRRSRNIGRWPSCGRWPTPTPSRCR